MLYECDAMGVNEFILLYILLKSGMLGFTMLENYIKSKAPKSIIKKKKQTKPTKQTQRIILVFIFNFKNGKCQTDRKGSFFVFCFYWKQARHWTKTFTQLLKPNWTPPNEQKPQQVAGDYCCLWVETREKESSW